MQTTTTIKHYCQNSTSKKLDELRTIAQRYSYVKDYVFQGLYGYKSLLYLDSKAFYEFRNKLLKNKNYKQFGLQNKQWKLAVQEAVSNMKTTWTLAFEEVKKYIHKSNFNEHEKHYLFYLLKSPGLLYKALVKEQFDLPERFVKLAEEQNLVINRNKCHKYLKAKLRLYKNSRMISKQSRSFMIDADMYNLHVDGHDQVWLAIMGLKPRKTIKLQLTSKNVSPHSSLRIVLNNDMIEIHEPRTKTVPDPNPIKDCTAILSIDKGKDVLIDTHLGTQFGKEFGTIINEESDKVSKKMKKRHKLHSLVKKNIERNDLKKAKKIEKNNLGRKKFNLDKKRREGRIKTFVGKAVNAMFEKHAPDCLVVEKLNFTSRKKHSKNANRKLSAWTKGILQKKLDLKSRQSGALSSEVNCAWTSQTCPQCGSVDAKNRTGNEFHCRACGREGNANHFAALNILSRVHDSEIESWMNPKAVKAILQSRFNHTVVGSSDFISNQGHCDNQDSRCFDSTRIQSESELIQNVHICGGFE